MHAIRCHLYAPQHHPAIHAACQHHARTCKLMELSLPYHNCVRLARHECALSPGHSYHPVTNLCHHAALQPKHIARMILRPATVLQHATLLLTPVPQVQRSAQGGHNPTHVYCIPVAGGGQAQERGTAELRSGMVPWAQTGRQLDAWDCCCCKAAYKGLKDESPTPMNEPVN